ncbi:MAG: penicillin-binding protein 2 [Acidobacteriota bacterium]|nr:penicillin-binding protein 2 [Acidobacteriota bacterium]
MTPKFRFPRLVALAFTALFLFTIPSAHAAVKASKKSAARAVATKSASRARGGRESASTRRDSRQSKRERVADARRSRNDRSPRSDRRSRREERAAARESRRDTRGMSRRERMQEARREAERRRREAAERARQIAIARAIALARQRAADQALRDETAANIAKDETTGEDLEVRRAALDALGDKAGTVVVMNPKTGQVYTVVNQDWGLRRGFKPCSTTKLVTGLAGLSEHVIDPVQTINIGTSSYSLDLTDSLAFSNNGYFQRVGGQVGFDKMMEYARKLGLGEPTGINFPGESPGRLPVFKQGYAVNHMSSHGDDIEVTAIQLARLTSAIANGGQLLIPHMPRTPEENVRFKREVKRDINIPQENVNRMIPGMIGAVNYGTAKRAYNPLETIAGKTGSCIGQGSWLGLFTSYAPVQDPQLAITVILRNSGARGKYASAVAGDVYRRLTQSARFAPKPGSQPVLANDMLTPRPHIDPRKAAEVSDEEKEDEATEASKDAFVVSEAGDGSTGSQTGSQTTGQPAVQKTARTIERPVAPASAPAANTNSITPATKSNNSSERPRRVTDKP